MNFPIFDADAHISPPGQGGNSQTLEQLLQSLDYAGVDKALAWLQPPYLREIDEAISISIRRCRTILTAFWALVG